MTKTELVDQVAARTNLSKRCGSSCGRCVFNHFREFGSWGKGSINWFWFI